MNAGTLRRIQRLWDYNLTVKKKTEAVNELGPLETPGSEAGKKKLKILTKKAKRGGDLKDQGCLKRRKMVLRSLDPRGLLGGPGTARKTSLYRTKEKVEKNVWPNQTK